MGLHYLKTRRHSLAEDACAPVTVTAYGFSLGEKLVAWQTVSEIRAWKCDRLTTAETVIGFTFGDCCVAVSEERAGFDILESAMIAAFPATSRWRQAVLNPPFESNETVLFRRA